ncbi:MAG: hypothetical protein HYZ15_12905 [Sphingobacteriales bacterium]|nr:hypothetical protein [Sphingobacteriales bacterium]
MRKKLLLVFLHCFLLLSLCAQQPLVQKLKIPVKNNRIFAGPSVPLGQFSSTHYPGITISYMRMPSRPVAEQGARGRKTGFASGGSLSHFWGKKEKAGSRDFRYPGYTVLELQGGLTWTPLNRGILFLAMGPGLGYYEGRFRFIAGAGIQGSYPLSPIINISPALSLIKEKGSDALWIASLKAGLRF